MSNQLMDSVFAGIALVSECMAQALVNKKIVLENEMIHKMSATSQQNLVSQCSLAQQQNVAYKLGQFAKELSPGQQAVLREMMFAASRSADFHNNRDMVTFGKKEPDRPVDGTRALELSTDCEMAGFLFESDLTD